MTYSARIEDLKLYLKKNKFIEFTCMSAIQREFLWNDIFFCLHHIFICYLHNINKLCFHLCFGYLTILLLFCYVSMYLSIYLSLYVFMYVCVYACMCVFIYEFIHEFILPWKESLLMKYSWINRKKAITRRLVCNI